MKAQSHPIDVIILAGGKGTRLASVVSDVPKPLAPVMGQPFLNFVLKGLSDSGLFSSVTLSLGHQAEKVVDHYKANPPPIPLEFVIEKEPLGTGGATLFALNQLSRAPELLFVLNGDSLVRVDFPKMLERHRAHHAEASLALVNVADAARYGRVELKGSKITAFREKSPESTPGLINAGVYLFDASALRNTAPNVASFSLEKEVFPQMVAREKIYGETIQSPFIDIGLPETYAAAAEFVQRF